MTELKFQFSQFVGDGGQMVIRGDDFEEFMEDYKTFIENSAKIQDGVVALSNTFGISGAGNNKPEVKTTQKRNSARQVKPGSAPASGDAGNCEHGEPWKDLNGQTYKSGAKKGQLYAARYYNTCDNRSCSPWGEHE